ncbi:dienelactone hydrolase family protein [Pseudomonas sp. BN414]|uniref:dienelactone hydrolase family protein n=1 Tax=unclassified Pseudomonas TaxID=196821 RepID=UPI002458433C|nr:MULTISPECIES: dienelactone hydrolase family protein [unclassified Pseudomonas]MDH4565249.1 dienelactone hydrolase family protein [Pseudomonas sp. BN414]MDH4581969.1 dienelactone hydrolase family protein [Pseudomonas sp. BN415]
MNHEQVSIETHDGKCQAHIFKPEGQGPWPAVIFCMDGFGIRPTLFQMARRLAQGGYVVLLPDLFYRAGRYGPLAPAEIFRSRDVMGAIGHLLASTDNHKAARDAQAFIDYLDTRTDVASPNIGTTGYCMGGGISLSIAGTYPDRILAAASFHGGNLATDAETSPHLLAPSIKARVYVASADRDDYYSPQMARRLEKALLEAGVDHRCETYAGALHGFAVPDFQEFKKEAAERHWRELFGLLETTLII